MEDGMELEQCELCQSLSRVHCAADEAKLCWECDAQVHGANFLVARHFRSLLCAKCGAPTGRFGTGFRMQPKVCLCKSCAHSSDRAVEESEIASCASSVVSDRTTSESEGRQPAGRRKAVSASGTTGITGGKGSSSDGGDGHCRGWIEPWSGGAGAAGGRSEGWCAATSDSEGADDEGYVGGTDGWRCRWKRSRGGAVEEECVSSANSGVGSVGSAIQAQKKKRKKEKKSIFEVL